MTTVINVVGVGRQSGKTTLVEALAKEFSKRFTVWTVKHITTHFDTTEKDTWRHLHAGAKVVIAISDHEIVMIKRNIDISLEEALEEVPEEVNLVLVEGFKESRYPKIIVAQKVDDAKRVLNIASQVFAIHGINAAEIAEKEIEGIPILKLEGLVPKIEKEIVKDIITKLPRLNCQDCDFSNCEALAQAIFKGEASLDRCKVIFEEKTTLTVDGARIYLSAFPRDFIRNTVLGMVGSLKGTNKNRIKHIHLEIEV